MRRLLTIALTTMSLLAVASMAFAADGAMDGASMSFVFVGTAIGMAIAAAGCGIAQGMGLKAACEGVARNPEASGKLTITLILGLAFIESLAIYALVINLILLFAKGL